MNIKDIFHMREYLGYKHGYSINIPLYTHCTTIFQNIWN